MCDSTQKRMSMLVSRWKVKIYAKGVDTIILEWLSKNQLYTKTTLAYLKASYIVQFSDFYFVDDIAITQQGAFECSASCSETF